MDMIRSSFQVQSIENFTCQHFQQLFKGGNNNHGTITTTGNGRTYHAIWDTSTDTFSVKRDLTGVDTWTRISETLDRWSQFDFTSHAEEWQSRLTIQKHNVALADPLRAPVDELLLQLEGVDTCVEPRHYPSKAIQDQLTQISSPLIRLLDEKKQSLIEQAQQLSMAVNDNVTSNQLWTQQQNIKNAINNLQAQGQQLELFIENIKNTIRLYCAVVGSIDASTNSIVYDAVTTRLAFVAIKIRLMLDAYFTAGGNVPKAEITAYNNMIKNEGEIARAFHSQQIATHFTYNELLSPPSYENSGGRSAQKQDKINFNYQTHIFTFTSVLGDTTKTFTEIQDAAEELKLARNRWQEQIHLEEEIDKLLIQFQDNDNEKNLALHPIWMKHSDQLRELKKNLFNRGELLGLVSFELLQSEYINIGRANVLYVDIDQFLEGLPGFMAIWKTSNYNQEMQSRALHLTVLRNMCREDESLTEHALSHMERFVTVHKNVIQQWVNSDAFSRIKFHDPIPAGLAYPKWLVAEHDLFQQKSQKILKTLWETKYQALRNVELMKVREQLLEKVQVKTEKLVEASEEFEESAKKLLHAHSLSAKISDFLSLKPGKVKINEEHQTAAAPQ